MKIKSSTVVLTDESPCPVSGKHFGRPMGKLSASFLDWLRGQSWLERKYPAVAAYIKKNQRVIDAELANPSKYGITQETEPEADDIFDPADDHGFHD